MNSLRSDIENGRVKSRADYDAIVRIVEAMRELGYDDEDIARSGRVGIPSSLSNVDFNERPDLRVASQLLEYESGPVSNSPDEKLAGILRWSPRTFSTETWGTRDNLSDPIETVLGYAVQNCDADGSPWNDYSERLPHTEGGPEAWRHPESFRIRLQNPDDGSLVDEFAFRFPPGEATLNVSAVAYAVSDQLLEPRGYTIRQIDLGGKLRTYLLIEQDRLESLRQTYGRRLRMFTEFDCDGPLLAEKRLIEDALHWYDPEERLDHEAEYGFPEPSNVYKLEEQPEANRVLDSGEPSD